jgi:hypothetical protein
LVWRVEIGSFRARPEHGAVLMVMAGTAVVALALGAALAVALH